MKRIALCAFAVLAIGLMLAPGALASTGVKHAAPMGMKHATMARPLAAPAASGPYSITGHVLDYSGNPSSRPPTSTWGWWDGNALNYRRFQQRQRDRPVDGKFQFSNVSSEPGNNDFLDVLLLRAAALEELRPWSLDFATMNDLTASPNTYEIQPAQVNLTSADAPTAPVEVKVGEQDTGFASSMVQFASGSAVASVLPPSFDDVVAYQYNSIGAVTCAGGVRSAPPSASPRVTRRATRWTSTGTTALHSALAGPTCQHSGKPGTTVKMALSSWPAGYRAEFAGLSDAPVLGPVSTGAASTVAVKVSTKLPVGHLRDRHLPHTTTPRAWSTWRTTTRSARSSRRRARSVTATPCA